MIGMFRNERVGRAVISIITEHDLLYFDKRMFCSRVLLIRFRVWLFIAPMILQDPILEE